MKHIIWNKVCGLPTVAHDDLQTALEEAKRLAALQPYDVFEVYGLAATVYGEVKVNVQMEGQSAAPLSQDVAPVKPAIDLRTCVKGQKLRLRNGEIAEYLGKTMEERYPHYTSSGATVTDYGYQIINDPGDYDVIEILPLHYPHLRPVPPELLPLPEGAVYLGRGREIKHVGPFVAHHRFDEEKSWWGLADCAGANNAHYCAPADSEIVKLNREGGK